MTKTSSAMLLICMLSCARPAAAQEATWGPILKQALPLLNAGPMAEAAANLNRGSLDGPHSSFWRDRIVEMLEAETPQAFQSLQNSVKAEKLAQALAPLTADAKRKADGLRYRCAERFIEPERFLDQAPNLLADPFLIGDARKYLAHEFEEVSVTAAIKRVQAEQPELEPAIPHADEAQFKKLDHKALVNSLHSDMGDVIRMGRNRVKRQEDLTDADFYLKKWDAVESQLAYAVSEPQKFHGDKAADFYRQLQPLLNLYIRHTESDQSSTPSIRAWVYRRAELVMQSLTKLMGREHVLAELEEAAKDLGNFISKDGRLLSDEQDEGLRTGLNRIQDLVISGERRDAKRALTAFMQPAEHYLKALQDDPKLKPAVRQRRLMTLQMAMAALGALAPTEN